MKRIISAVAVLLFVAVSAPLFAAQRRLVDDVIRMSRAGVSDDSIITFVQSTRGRLDITADDIIAMTEAGLSKPLIKAIIDESAASRKDSRETAYAPRYYPPAYYDPYYYYDPYWYAPRVYLGFGYTGFYGGGFRGGFRGGHRGHR
jgi:hypothetical protein